MASLFLILLAAISSDGAPESGTATSWIDRLGSPRFADRQLASDALAALGREALPQLRLAKHSGDPEIQNRIEGVIDRIEREQLHAPTLVRLDSVDAPLDNHVRAIGERTGFAVQVERSTRGDWHDRRHRWSSPDARPFWEVLEELGLDGSWSTDREPGMSRIRPQPIFRINDRSTAVASSIDGPFRFAFRDMRLVPREEVVGGVRLTRSDPKPARASALQIQLELIAEPRLQLRVVGDPQLLEAADDRGRSLLSGDGMGPMTADSWGGYEPSVSLTAQLESPPRTGARIARLKGQVPVEIQARRLEPIEIPVEIGAPAALPTPVWCGDVTFIACRLLIDRFVDPTVEVVVQPEGWSQMSMFMMRRRWRGGGLNEQQAELVERLLSNLELVDAEGRLLARQPTRSTNVMPDGLHVYLPIDNGKDIGDAPRVQYHSTLREAMTLNFEFRDIPVTVKPDRK